MPFVPVPSTALVELRMTLDLQQVENTLWFVFQDPIDEAILTTLNNDLLGWWVDHYAPLVSQQLQLREIVCTDMSSSTGPQVTLAAPPGTVGELTVDAEPNNVSLTVSFRTANRGRSFRGRNYLVGITADVLVNNTFTSVYVSSVTDAYAALLPAGGVLSDARWVVASRFSGIDSNGDPIPRVTGIATPITAVVVVDSIVDSQRRRLPKRGN